MPDNGDVASSGIDAMNLPRWDLTALFPGLETPEFAQAYAALMEQIDALPGLFDSLGIARGEPVDIDEALARRFEQALPALNDVEERVHAMMSYLHGHVTTDSRDEQAQARLSELQMRSIVLETVQTRFEAWIGSLRVDELIERSPLAAAHAYPLRLLQQSARHLMSDQEESLAAELRPSAGSAWSKLHGNLTSQLMVPLEDGDSTRFLPMSEIRNLAMAGARDLRRQAWSAELAAWEAQALPLAAALNGVKGQVLVLGNRRQWRDPLDETLFWSGIDHEILDVMVTEARKSFTEFRRYLRAKAKALGLESLAWYDLFAPVGGASRSWDWSEAGAFIITQFGTFSERMAGLAKRAFTESWIDAGPRAGKVGGAYCMWLLRDQSRILANYSATYDGVSTLAHELGHAYHNLNQTGLTALQRQNPMTLAETASTFCETLVKEAALVNADVNEQRYIIEQSLQGACQIVVDILSRFDFEQALFAARRTRELSVSELCQMMLEAQEGTYGDGLDAEERHPYMWAVKGHYYSTERSYYNFPYLFGQLFGLGLYAEFKRRPEGFAERYDALLRGTGLATAADLAAEFGIDLRSADFWRASLDLIRADIARFEALVDERGSVAT